MSLEIFAPDAQPPAAVHPDVGPWPEAVGTHPPSARAAVVKDGLIVARLSIWRRGTASYRGRPTRYVGHIAAADRAALSTLLRGVAEIEAGPAHSLLGPIDGNTWRRYRVVTDAGDTQPFPLEPTNPSWWGPAFEDAGFAMCEQYWSGARRLESAVGSVARVVPDGIVLRSIRKERLADELAAVYELVVEAFAANPLFTPVPLDQFLSMYTPLAGLMDPRLSLIAERSSPVGLTLCMPADASRIVLKTIAVGKQERGTGLGRLLMDEVAARGRTFGYDSLVYALMHDDNRSSDMVKTIADPIRRYALYSCGLEA